MRLEPGGGANRARELPKMAVGTLSETRCRVGRGRSGGEVPQMTQVSLRLRRLARSTAALLLTCCSALAAEPGMQIAGTEETVISADEMKCQPDSGRGIDVTDIPVSAFRRGDGVVVLLSGNRQNFFLQGPDLDHVRRVGCQSLLRSEHNGDPAQFRDNEWLQSAYTRDGRYILGFVHDEYHGEEHGYRNCDKSDPRQRTCWYAAVTMVESHDGGVSFSHPNATTSVLLALPYRFQEGLKRAGAASPKVVSNPKDGMVYVLANYVDRNQDIRVGQCLMRGNGTGLTGWRMWNGADFVAYDADPYQCAGACTGNRPPCRP